jgi:hypothetical protein
LASVSKNAHHQFHAELLAACNALHEVIGKVNDARHQARTEQVMKTLFRRVTAWKAVDPDTFGPHMLSSVLTVRLGGADINNAHIFLFERGILCCEDSVASPTISLHRRLKSLTSTPSQDTSWSILEYLSILTITRVALIPQTPGMRNSISILIIMTKYIGQSGRELLVQGRAAHMILRFPDEPLLLQWQTEIESLRLRRKPIWEDGANPIFYPTPPIASPMKEIISTLPEVVLENQPRLFVKVHFKTHAFTVALSQPVDYDALVERVANKIRFCGGSWSQDRQIQVKGWDGSMVGLTRQLIDTTFADFRASSLTVFVT